MNHSTANMYLKHFCCKCTCK